MVGVNYAKAMRPTPDGAVGGARTCGVEVEWRVRALSQACEGGARDWAGAQIVSVEGAW